MYIQCHMHNPLARLDDAHVMLVLTCTWRLPCNMQADCSLGKVALMF